MKKRLLILTMIMMLLFSTLIIGEAFGASVSATLSGGGNYTKGQTFTVTLTYSGATFGSADVVFNYNTSVLQLVSSSDGPQSASGVFTQSVVNENGTSALSCTATFKTIGTGNTTITATTSNVYNLNFEPLSANTASASVSVTNPQSTASGNANLSSLKVSAGSLSPAFSPGRTSYTVNVGKDVSVCTVSATPEHSKATVSVGGSKNLKEGKNVRTVTVTAENGTTKTYTITINRAGSSGSDNPDTDTPDEPPTDTPQDIIVTVGDVEYTVVETIDENNIPKGFTLTLAQYGEYDIPVIKDSDLKYTLVLLKNSNTGDEEWFFYDEETDSFSSTSQLSADEAMEYSKLLAASDGKEDESAKIGKTEKILIISLGGTLMAMFIAIIVLQTKIIKKNRPKTNKKSNEEVIIEDEES